VFSDGKKVALQKKGEIKIEATTAGSCALQIYQQNSIPAIIKKEKTRSLQIWPSESPGLLQRPMGVSGRAATVDWKITTTLPHTLLSWLLLEIVEWHLLENPFLFIFWYSYLLASHRPSLAVFSGREWSFG